MKPNKDIEERLFSKLESYQSIDTEADWQKVRERMGTRKHRYIRPFWQTAAAIILLLGVGFLAQRYLDLTPERILVEAGNQMQELELPDGSVVTLNKQATLIYPEKFSRRQRGMALSGEAYFEVVSDPAKIFVVDVEQKARVRVLGTKFNISPDTNSESISVQVVEGKVAFSPTQGGSEEIILEENQQATLREGAIIRDDTVDRNFLSWQTGKLIFHLDGIEDVLNQLQEHYGIEIVLDDIVPEDLLFTSTLDNQDLESVLDEISLVLDLDYRYENEKVIFTQQE